MKFIFTSLSLILSTQLFSQITVDPCEIYFDVMRDANFDSLDHYLTLDKDQLHISDKIDLLRVKGVALARLYKKDIKERTKRGQIALDSSYHMLTKAIDLVEDENLKLNYLYSRYSTFGEIGADYPELNEDKEIIEEHGFKQFKLGPAITPLVKYDGDVWLGLEGSLFAGQYLPFHLKNSYGHTIDQRKFTVGLSAISGSYIRNLQRNASEVKFSLLRIEAPFYLDITQFGFIRDLNLQFDETNWFYRPEVGVGFHIFSISYGFNIFLNDPPINFENKHSVSLRAKFVID